MPLPGQQHRYQSCRDAYCERPYCRIWKEAMELASEFISAAYADGYRAGVASVPQCSCGGAA